MYVHKEIAMWVWDIFLVNTTSGRSGTYISNHYAYTLSGHSIQTMQEGAAR